MTTIQLTLLNEKTEKRSATIKTSQFSKNDFLRRRRGFTFCTAVELITKRLQCSTCSTRIAIMCMNCCYCCWFLWFDVIVGTDWLASLFSVPASNTKLRKQLAHTKILVGLGENGSRTFQVKEEAPKCYIVVTNVTCWLTVNRVAYSYVVMQVVKRSSYL